MKEKINQKILLYKVQTKKDPESFAKLYDIYVKKIYRFVYFKVSNHEEAEDLTSEVFLKAWNYIIAGNNVKSFGGLLYTLARNKVIDLYRKRAQTRYISTEEIDIPDDFEMDESIASKQEVKLIIKGLKKLKHEYREIVTLKYIDELSTSEISQITGKGKVSVRVTLHRAIKKLKQIIGE